MIAAFVLRIAVINCSGNSGEQSQEAAAAANVTAARSVLSRSAASNVRLPPERMASNGDPLRIDPRYCFQERERTGSQVGA